ncbi:MAG: hypothetical protein KJ901_05500 [Gammaproteobacteria bacterium]|nr:hypothetical protein [Gammaproteobacteria bacterium]MBU1442920.1 hypothetical protein [Gammaproteobacteria bacterium]
MTVSTAGRRGRAGACRGAVSASPVLATDDDAARGLVAVPAGAPKPGEPRPDSAEDGATGLEAGTGAR